MPMNNVSLKSGLGIAEIIGDRRDEILALAASHNTYNVRIFGSVARGDARPDSDIDFLVNGLENAPWGGGSLLVALEKLLGRHVDVVSEEDLHPLIRPHVLREAQPL
jgi:predicted nucleotidyltransferase